MQYLRTPEDRFHALPDYPFQAHYHEVGPDGMRMHYLDEGSTGGTVVLLLHGEPSWSFLYRHMIPGLVANGYRCIAPDLIGFGKSDKPTEPTDYSYQRHLDWLKSLLVALDLQKITLFCQDWGGLLGLRMAAEMGGRFARIVAANTFLPTGDIKPHEAFLKWQAYAAKVPVFPVGQVLQRATVRALTPAEVAAYEAPFPAESYKAGARIFPALVPSSPDDPATEANRKAWTALGQWQKPFLTLFGDSDPITAGLERLFQQMIPGSQGQAHQTIPQAGHFLQEDQGPLLAKLMVEFMEKK